MEELIDLQIRLIKLRRSLYSACQELSEALHEIQLLLADPQKKTPPAEIDKPKIDTPKTGY